MDNVVLGFAFDDDRYVGGVRVIVIHKQHPDWQKGKFNGIGGHIRPGEIPHRAMVREFYEETGIETGLADWKLTVRMYVAEHDTKVYVFRATLPRDRFRHVDSPEFTRTREMVSVYTRTDLLDKLNIIPNLHWLIPLQFEDLQEPVSIDVASGERL